MLEFRIKQLEWENEILKKKNKKKKQYIQELEDERDKIERNKKHSLANVTLGNITSNAIETFAKSDFGIGILKNVFGAKQEVLNGLLGLDANTEHSEKAEVNETKSTASIVTETKMDLSDSDKVRLQVIKHINDFMLNADDAVLRLYYELIMLIGKDVNLLQSIYMQLKGVKKNTEQNHTVTMSGEDTTEGTKKNGNGIDDS